MSTTISAPGKVLIAGGYLVLDPAYSGVVIATSSRFYTTIFNTPNSTSNETNQSRIRVSSPQFEDATWEYSLNTSSKSFVTPISGGRNKFVELALDKTLKLIKAIKRSRGESTDELTRGLQIVIVGDNDFYSQRKELDNLSLPSTLASLSSLPPFNSTHTTLGKVHKTGLGSSAALITSLVAGLLVHFGVVDGSHLSSSTSSTSSEAPEEAKNELALIHNTSQFIHCLAQGKVGSGFDVSSAVYGGQVYRRFGADVLAKVMGDDFTNEDEGEVLLNTLRPSAHWTNQVSPLALPPRFRLLLADVDAGSDTPSLVGKVLKWRKENVEDANEIYTSLSGQNDRLSILLRRLSTFAARDRQKYDRTMESLSREKIGTGMSSLEARDVDRDVVDGLQEVAKVMATIRVLMKRMGTAAGVPIEPDEQTRLLDKCVEVEGVIGGGVPGAGGYDALFLLIIEPSSTPVNAISTIESIWGGWKELSLCPLSCSADRGGLKLESIDEVDGLKEVLEKGRR